MRGAGKDATGLYNEAHPWVAYEMILKSVQVGRVSHVSPLLSRLHEERVHQESGITSEETPPTKFSLDHPSMKISDFGVNQPKSGLSNIKRGSSCSNFLLRPGSAREERVVDLLAYQEQQNKRSVKNSDMSTSSSVRIGYGTMPGHLRQNLK